MKVLVACEESQAVCIAFREKGHEAFSCDIVRWVHKATGQKKSCSKWYNTNTSQHSKHRSKTFKGVAFAMAEQWG